MAFARIPDEVIDEIRRRADIVDIVSESVDLKKTGANLKGLCPFHQEKTPSFIVNPTRGTYYCFGCQQGGDSISFLRETRGLSFIETIRWLGDKLGVVVPTVEQTPEQDAADKARRDTRDWLLRANAESMAFYAAALSRPEGAPGRAYLKERGVGSATVEAFKLGYADPQWESLNGHLLTQGIPQRYVLEAGLARPRNQGDGHYDFFRNRLVCPVSDRYGRVVGFGARALAAEDEARAKYVNTPETAIFKKGQTLFGLEQARAAIRQRGRALLVEGNFDVLLLHEHGFEETVASLGTALTEEQVSLLNRQTDRVYLLYDGDAAGRKSALAAIPRFIDEDLLVWVVPLPEKTDPDDIVRREGAEGLQRRLEQAVPGVEFAIRTLLPDRGATPEEKDRGVRAIGRLVSRLSSPLARSEYLRMTADILGVDQGVLASYFRVAAPASASGLGGPRGRTASATTRDFGGEALLRLLVGHPRLCGGRGLSEIPELLGDTSLARAIAVWIGLVETGRHHGGAATLIETMAEEDRQAVARCVTEEAVEIANVEPEKLLDQLLSQVRRRRRRRSELRALVDNSDQNRKT